MERDPTPLATRQAARIQRSATRAEPHGAQWYLVRPAHRLPVEDDPAPIRFRKHLSPALPDLGAGGRLPANLAGVLEALRRSQGYRLALPVDGQRDGVGPGKRGDQTGKDPTNRGKLGTKRHMLTDANGIPLAVTLSGANRNDMKMFGATLDALVIPRPSPKKVTQHLCNDKGYDYPEIRRSAARRGYIAHIKSRGQEEQERKKNPRYKARRWVVERSNRWHNLFRRLKIRYEVHAENYLGFVQFANALICWRRATA